MKQITPSKAGWLFLVLTILTSCVTLTKTPSLELGVFTQQELNEARRIHSDAPYWYGVVASENDAD